MAEDKRKLLEEAQAIADKMLELKSIITKMLDELDVLQLKYFDKIEKIKQK